MVSLTKLHESHLSARSADIWSMRGAARREGSHFATAKWEPWKRQYPEQLFYKNTYARSLHLTVLTEPKPIIEKH